MFLARYFSKPRLNLSNFRIKWLPFMPVSPILGVFFDHSQWLAACLIWDSSVSELSSPSHQHPESTRPRNGNRPGLPPSILATGGAKFLELHGRELIIWGYVLDEVRSLCDRQKMNYRHTKSLYRIRNIQYFPRFWGRKPKLSVLEWPSTSENGGEKETAK